MGDKPKLRYFPLKMRAILAAYRYEPKNKEKMYLHILQDIRREKAEKWH